MGFGFIMRRVVARGYAHCRFARARYQGLPGPTGIRQPSGARACPLTGELAYPWLSAAPHLAPPHSILVVTGSQVVTTPVVVTEIPRGWGTRYGKHAAAPGGGSRCGQLATIRNNAENYVCRPTDAHQAIITAHHARSYPPRSRARRHRRARYAVKRPIKPNNPTSTAGHSDIHLFYSFVSG